MQPWELERPRQAGNTWSPGRALLYSLAAQMPEHTCHLPIRARIEWADTVSGGQHDPMEGSYATS